MPRYLSDLDGALIDSDQKLGQETAKPLNALIHTGRLDFSVAAARSPLPRPEAIATAWG